MGSAFYGIYFIVSYPMFYWLDEYIHKKLMKPHTLYQTVMEAFACGMIVLLFLDFARLYLGVKLIIPGLAFCENESLKQCIGL